MELSNVFKAVLALFFAGLVTFTFGIASLVDNPCKTLADTDGITAFWTSDLITCNITYTYLVNSELFKGQLKVPSCANSTMVSICYDWNNPSRHLAATHELDTLAYSCDVIITWVGVGLLVPMLIFLTFITFVTRIGQEFLL